MTIKSNMEKSTELQTGAMRAELERVLASQMFAKSPRLAALLRYICEHSMEGRLEELTEQQICNQHFSTSAGLQLG